jgi:4-amino-4-deoxy-L-arabinose transferase-like glycosyltransferase
MLRNASLTEKIILLLITVAAFALRLTYLLYSHPFIDEFTTVLAARAILQHGLPLLPSGLFYEHGFLFSYLDAPFVGLAGEKISFALARLPSLLIGTAAIPFLYWIGRRWLSPQAGLVAAALLAFSPEGIVWGGRARMYALAQLLVLLLAFLVYEGSLGKGRPRLRWLALLTLLAVLLTQLGSIILVPSLLIGALVVGWLTCPNGARPWFFRPAVLAEGSGLAVSVGLGLLVKRLGQPLGAVPLSDNGPGNLLAELAGTVTYQAGLVLDSQGTIKFLARQFGVPHHLWLTFIALAGGLVSLAVWLSVRKSASQRASEPASQQTPVSQVRVGNSREAQSLISPGLPASPSCLHLSARHRWPGQGAGNTQSPLAYPPGQAISLLFLWLVFGLTVLVMVTLLQDWRRNPRYLVLALPLFYLIVAGGLGQIANLPWPTRRGKQSLISRSRSQVAVALFAFVIVQAGLLVPDLRIAYRTPEPAYEKAFQYVADRWQPGDVLLTMNTSAAGLYLGPAGYSPEGTYRFAIQEDARQFLLNADTQPVDRWLGVPWVGTAPEFNRLLNQHARVWFVVDTIRLPVYYRGDWLAILNSRMTKVWSQDEALVYLTRPDGTPVPADPDVPLDARFGDMIALKGYSLARKGDYPQERVGPCAAGQMLCLEPGSSFQVTLFWQALAPVDADYTIFVHVRNAQGTTVAQKDSQPFDGLYPTSQWQLGETVAQPLEVDLPFDLAAGPYSLYIGLYRLDTMTRLTLENDSSGENALILYEAIMVEPSER